MDAREYLKQLQSEQSGSIEHFKSYDEKVRARYVRALANATPDGRKILEDNLRILDKEEESYRKRLPTPYQSIQDYKRLDSAKLRLDETLRRGKKYSDRGFFPCEKIVFGSIETSELNSWSTYWPDSSEYLIIFNRGLLLALLTASNLVIWAMQVPPASQDLGPHGFEPVYGVDQDILQRLAPNYLRLFKAIKEGREPDPDLYHSFVQLQEPEARWTNLENAAFDFAFAHEYAHILLGHTNPGTRARIDNSWGEEYVADGLALELIVDSWLSQLDIFHPAMIALVLQGVVLFLNFLSQTEQYSAEVSGSSAQLWSAQKSHPFTRVRLIRMIKHISGRPSAEWWKIVAPELIALDKCLHFYYAVATNSVKVQATAATEWQFQSAAVEALGSDDIVPAHMFITMRCARASITGNSAIDRDAVSRWAQEADRELAAAGARPLLDYRPPLLNLTLGFGLRAVEHKQTAGLTATVLMLDRLADAFLLDARTRFPLLADYSGTPVLPK